jgi:hypothetical protein
MMSLLLLLLLLLDGWSVVVLHMLPHIGEQ